MCARHGTIYPNDDTDKCTVINCDMYSEENAERGWWEMLKIETGGSGKDAEEVTFKLGPQRVRRDMARE